ncbi:L-rhamnose mutarotase [Siculibacillus lacustris]|uniref:L-rhamnose mutarotase n=1 Tax=Siculibacillus lacustris TaxID=1549641 RepID=A0A4Q9VY07_9HYPH|nr:L-rhamnose mutarotase [Siculibacillus lacustris]TBW41382.1 L-rhamnose mutarotase [Siculibacillus lacustris]
MTRKAFLMAVDPAAHDEYRRRHDAIWPELAAVLSAHGASNYSIWLDAKRSLLFAQVEIDSEERWAAVAATDVCRRWWAFMADIMPSNPDGSPVSEDLVEVFHLA